MLLLLLLLFSEAPFSYLVFGIVALSFAVVFNKWCYVTNRIAPMSPFSKSRHTQNKPSVYVCYFPSTRRCVVLRHLTRTYITGRHSLSANQGSYPSRVMNVAACLSLSLKYTHRPIVR